MQPAISAIIDVGEQLSFDGWHFEIVVMDEAYQKSAGEAPSRKLPQVDPNLRVPKPTAGDFHQFMPGARLRAGSPWPRSP